MLEYDFCVLSIERPASSKLYFPGFNVPHKSGKIAQKIQVHRGQRFQFFVLDFFGVNIRAHDLRKYDKNFFLEIDAVFLQVEQPDSAEKVIFELAVLGWKLVSWTKIV